MPELAADSRQNRIPSLGLLALALTSITYALDHSGLVQVPTTSLGTVLLLGGGLQLLAGLHTGHSGSVKASTTLLPLGLFWLSLIGFEVFPTLGFGKAPSTAALVAYLSMWGFFVALLFLGSFRQGRALQLVFATLMICLIFLALGCQKENQLLLLFGSLAGVISGLVAGYTGLVQLYSQWFGRASLPRDGLHTPRDEDVDESLAP
jgi:succinate-acetate transporter protein